MVAPGDVIFVTLTMPLVIFFFAEFSIWAIVLSRVERVMFSTRALLNVNMSRFVILFVSNILFYFNITSELSQRHTGM